MWWMLQTSSLTCLWLAWIFPSCPATLQLPTCSFWGDSRQSGLLEVSSRAHRLMGPKCRDIFSWPVLKSLCKKSFKAQDITGATVLTFKPSFWSTAVTTQSLQPSPTQFAQHRRLFLSKQRRKLPEFLGEPVKTHLPSSQLKGTVK